MDTDRVRQRLRTAVTRRRHRKLLQAADRYATALQNALRNQYNWDFDLNGETRTLKRAIGGYPGAVLDVGANRGQWATQALPHLNRQSLHCFEAVPAIFQELRSAIGDRDGLYLNNLALGAETGTIEFNYCHQASDTSSRYDIPAEYATGVIERVTARVSTGDEYCAAHGVDSISMLKVDVEGMEYEVLSGFRRLLKDRRVGVVQFEYGPGYIGARRYLVDVCVLLNDVGYNVFRQFPDGLEAFTYTNKDEDFRARNFVAIAN